VPSALIVRDNPDLRCILKKVLTDRVEMAAVIEVDLLDTAIEQLAAVDAISLVFINPELHGVEPSAAVRLLRRHFPGVRVAVLSPSRDRFATLLHLASGAHGQIDIEAGAEELTEALDLIRRGRVAVPSWLPDLWRDPPPPEEEDAEMHPGQRDEMNLHQYH